MSKAVKEIFKRNSTLQTLVTKVKQLTTLNQRFQEILSDPLSQHCKIANWREGTLMIETDSATFATLLRYQIPDLMSQLREFREFAGLISIQCYIQPHDNPIQPLSKASRHLSGKTLGLIKEFVASAVRS